MSYFFHPFPYPLYPLFIALSQHFTTTPNSFHAIKKAFKILNIIQRNSHFQFCLFSYNSYWFTMNYIPFIQSHPHSSFANIVLLYELYRSPLNFQEFNTKFSIRINRLQPLNPYKMGFSGIFIYFLSKHYQSTIIFYFCSKYLQKSIVDIFHQTSYNQGKGNVHKMWLAPYVLTWISAKPRAAKFIGLVDFYLRLLFLSM